MKRSLAMTVLALGLIALGCDDEDPPRPDAATATGGRGGSGGTGGGTGGTGGTAGTGGTSGTGGSRAPDARAPDRPRTPDGRGPDGRGPDGRRPDAAGSDTANAVSWVNCVDPKPGVASGDFCTQYNTACGYGAVMGRVAATSFDNAGACATRYNGYNATQQGCAAYHLCVASQTGMQAVHCPHPAQAAGPCALPAR